MYQFTVRRHLDVEHSSRGAVAFLHQIDRLAEYEPKVQSMRVTSKSKGCGTYQAAGLFAGLFPWRGQFSYALTKNGFHSKLDQPIQGVRVSGGFSVRKRSKYCCTVTHWETYSAPKWLLRPLEPLLRVYLARAIDAELSNVAKLVCDSD